MFGTFHPSIEINLKYLHLCYVKLHVYHNKLHENDCPSFMHTCISASFITKISKIMSVLTSFIYMWWKNDNNKLWLALFSWHLKITAFIKSKKFNRVITTIKTSYEKRLSLVPSFMHKHMTVQLHVLRYNCMVLFCPFRHATCVQGTGFAFIT